MGCLVSSFVVYLEPKDPQDEPAGFESNQTLGVHHAALKLCSLGEAAPCKALI